MKMMEYIFYVKKKGELGWNVIFNANQTQVEKLKAVDVIDA